MTPTPAQLRILQLTKDDGSLVIGGIDGRKVRFDVVKRMAHAGWLKWKAPTSFYEHSEWTLTDEGRRILGDKSE